MQSEDDEHGLQGDQIALPITTIVAQVEAVGLAEGYAIGVDGFGNIFVVEVVVGVEHG